MQAKCYLVAVDPAYLRALTPASMHAVALQGGAMTAEECRSFEALPFAAQALQLRRWDDLAKDPGKGRFHRLRTTAHQQHEPRSFGLATGMRAAFKSQPIAFTTTTSLESLGWDAIVESV